MKERFSKLRQLNEVYLGILIAKINKAYVVFLTHFDIVCASPHTSESISPRGLENLVFNEENDNCQLVTFTHFTS